MSLKGVLELENALAAKIAEIKGATLTGLLAAGVVIEKQAIENAPKDTGNLRSSAYTQATDTGAQVGFTSEYAPYVHENMEQKLKGVKRSHGKGSYWDNGGPKFLERAMNEKEQEALDKIAEFAKGAV